jgi:formate hydrogenlyase subunit 3/multisubunit Na+/H+ antiporter MnhD subunit
MSYLFLALAILAAGGVLSLLLRRAEGACLITATATTLAGCGAGLIAAWTDLDRQAIETFHAAWAVPGGSLSLRLDALANFFLLVIFGVGALLSVYGLGYWQDYRGRGVVGRSVCLYQWLLAALALVVTAANAVLFLMAWEIMTLTSFFLVTTDDEDAEVRRAGLIYLIASHLGTASLLVLFGLWGQQAGTLDFAGWSAPASPGLAGTLFVLAVVGFGTKAGFLPLHVWLPHAHPAAPTPVSALLSGVMIKLGIYGLLRVLTLLGPPPGWWGLTLLGIGVVSGLGGVVYALVQRDLKRVLAYSSVENVGIIALGLGTGVLGLANGKSGVAFAGFAGALLHVLNHSLFKSLLFCGAGCLVHATGTRQLEGQGGLLRRMPWTGTTFLIGCVAIGGLPPLNGFVGEWLVYYGLFQGSYDLPRWRAAAAMGSIGALALIGGLAAATFLRAFGALFLGEPRSAASAKAHEVGLALRLPLIALAGLCVGLGLFAPAGLALVRAPAQFLAGPAGVFGDLAGLAGLLEQISLVTGVLCGVILGLTLLRAGLLRGRPVTATGTWGCGFTQPTPRMQYTASSFAQPLAAVFQWLLRSRIRPAEVQGLFPADTTYEIQTEDLAEEGLFRPIFRGVALLTDGVRWLQQGYLQVYLLYIFGTLLVLLLWQLGR